MGAHARSVPGVDGSRARRWLSRHRRLQRRAARGLWPQPVFHPRRPALIGRHRLPRAGAGAQDSHHRNRAQATRLLLRGTHAVGVEYVQNGQVMRAEAAREVILCGGAFNTPQLLMLSGIGPAEHLRGVDITPVVDLPVGRNLQDHLAVFINLARRAAGPYRRAMRADRMGLAMAQAYLFGTGPGTVVPGGLHAFVKTRPDLAVPDG